MKSTAILKSIMGEELYESLNKALVKLGTKSVVDLEELHSAMKTAPKSVIAFLMKELKEMGKDETKEVRIPWDDTAKMTVTKLDADVYKGLIVKDGRVVHEFDLTAIPQLAAHIMSAFEIYDENENSSDSGQKSEPNSDMNQKLKALDDKINALMMLVASSSVNKSESLNKSIQIQGSLKKKFIDSVKGYGLKKAGQMPKMPTPPKAGTKVGGNQGLTQAGFHGDKTEHTDSNAKPVTQSKSNPYLKVPAEHTEQPKQPKQPKSLAQSEKTMTIQKSELTKSCLDCNRPVSSCACFKALSKPEIKKTEGQNVTLQFKSDWDQDSIQALYKSIKRTRD